ncbi:MAG: FAD-binding protein, partial [Beijerinckiaceae bacterium]
AIMEGGVQVNVDGERFHDESRGYSEAAAEVLAQPGGVAWTIFDRRIAAICRQFEDFRNAEAQGAIIEAATLDELAIRTRLQPSSLQQTFAQVEAVRERGAPDPFGRDFSQVVQLAPPYCAVKATGALFHTQGGLDIDARSRVLRSNGAAFGRLFAAGGAARGVSGPHASGYLSGNGLLTAVALGRIAGREAAKIALAQAEARRETHAQR